MQRTLPLLKRMYAVEVQVNLLLSYIGHVISREWNQMQDLEDKLQLKTQLY